MNSNTKDLKAIENLYSRILNENMGDIEGGEFEARGTAIRPYEADEQNAPESGGTSRASKAKELLDSGLLDGVDSAEDLADVLAQFGYTCDESEEVPDHVANDAAGDASEEPAY